MKALTPTRSKSNTKATVAILPCPGYETGGMEEKNPVFDALEKGIELLGGISQFAAPGENILLKPNLLIGDDPEKASITHPSVFQAVAHIFKNAGTNVYYGDSPALGKPERAARKSGYAEIAEKLGLRFADFTSGVSVSFPQATLAKQLILAKGALDADGIVSLPKLKTHGFTRLTGAVKNQFGCIPGMRKAEYHVKMPDIQDFSRVLVDINLYLRPRLYIMDAVMAMEGEGPRGGDPKHMGALLLSADPVALDTVSCALINLSPAYVPTNAIGREAGLGTDRLKEIEILTLPDHPFESFIDKKFDAARRPPDRIISSPFYPRFLKNFISPRPVILKENCVRCGRCVLQCPVKPKALNWPEANTDKEKSVPVFDYDRCIRCYCCHEICPEKAVKIKKPLLGRLFHR